MKIEIYIQQKLKFYWQILKYSSKFEKKYEFWNKFGLEMKFQLNQIEIQIESQSQLDYYRTNYYNIYTVF